MKKGYLKIKDDTDLKELEKFGFQKIKECHGFDPFYYASFDEDGYRDIIVTINKRIEKRSYSDKGCCILYDLINAGIVQKMKIVEKAVVDEE